MLVKPINIISLGFLILISSLGWGRLHPAITAYFTPAPSPVESILQPLPVESPPSGTTAYEAVARSLAGAQQEIYLAVYEFNIFHLSEILLSRLRNGVKVFLLIEADSLKLPETRFLIDRLYQAGAHIFPDQKKGGIMHNKFAVIDRKILITGSANYSVNAFFQQYNDVVVIDNPALAQKYLERFTELTEKIYRRRPSRPSLDPEKIPDLEQPQITYQAVFSRSYFDPTQIMVNQIGSCQKTISFLIFAFSSRPITEAMKSCSLKKVAVRGIFDNAFESENITQRWGTVPFQILWDAGAGVKYDNVDEKIHHKAIVIDHDTVITGSFNFSANAQRNNDENFLIIHSPDLAAQYQNRFQSLWEQFPNETLFETYIQDRNRKRTTLPFQEYEKKYFSRRASKIQKEMEGGFRGKVEVVQDGNTLVVRLDQSGERITVTLAGIIAPLFGDHSTHQQPQAHLAKEALIFLAGQREVVGKTVAGSGFRVQALLYAGEVFLNAAMLESGLAHPLFPLSPEDGTDIPLSYRNHPDWKRSLPHLQEAIRKAREEKRILWGELPLEVTPMEFISRWENASLQRKLKENHYSLAKYERNCWIGNRKTGKAYPPSSPTYMEYLRDLTDQKLIFFRTPQDAEAAGYLLRQEKNY